MHLKSSSLTTATLKEVAISNAVKVDEEVKATVAETGAKKFYARIDVTGADLSGVLLDYYWQLDYLLISTR